MLNCELCDYLKSRESKSSNESKYVCEFTGFVFHEKFEDYEMEYHPCYGYNAADTLGVKKETSISTKNNLKIA